MFMSVKYEHPELIVEISRLYILTEKDANWLGETVVRRLQNLVLCLHINTAVLYSWFLPLCMT